MQKNLLLPHGLKKIGWILLIPSLLLGIAYITQLFVPEILLAGMNLPELSSNSFASSAEEQWTIIISVLGIVIGVLLVACSRERIEDELTSQIRLNSLLMALYIYFAVVILLTLFVYGLTYVAFMTYSVLGFMVLFVAIFRFKLWRLRKEGADEE
ncbi:MAG: hypothetical protein LBM20_05405 [Rikenellaceae bacterium]|jgi:hypothetical protein|nr:hypothetical protein [Rikenellaceae bacterium]